MGLKRKLLEDGLLSQGEMVKGRRLKACEINYRLHYILHLQRLA